MNGRIGLLTGLLVIQLVIVALLLWNQNRADSAVEKLLDMEAKRVDHIVIADASEKIELIRKDDIWMVGDAPADATKANKLVNDFAGFESAWPVATTSTSAERFEVTEEKFQRRITFRSGENVLGDVLLGTSPGFQRVHARHVGAEAIYAVNFSNFQASTKADDWIDKAVLAADGAIKSLVAPSGFRLEKGDEGWLLDGAAADQDSATTFSERFENLRIIGTAAAAGANAKGVFTLMDGQGEYALEFSQGSEDTEYVVKSSRREGFYRIAAYIAEQMLEGKEELEPKPAATTGEPAEEMTPLDPVKGSE
jgi:hypothetical protein